MTYTKTRKKRNGSFSRKRSGANSPQRRGGSKRKSSITDIGRLVNKAEYKEEIPFVPSYSYNEMPFHRKLKSNLAKKGFTHPTQIQQDSIGHLLRGRDLIGVANTGTGKTAAFLIPIIERLLEPSSPQFTSLVVVPTRELALQVEEEFRSLTHGMGLYASSFIGGTSIGRNISQLRRRNHLLIGTPGRLMDLQQRGALRLKDISVLVLDEFDRMLDMGFVNDIKKIVEGMTRREQTLLFSATIDKTQQSLIDKMLYDPVEVKVSNGDSTSEQVDQDVIHVPKDGDKFNMLLGLIDDQEFEKVLIFAETKRQVERVSKKLKQSGIRVDQIHGNKTQNYRIKALDKFKKGRINVLVATDVAARGIDVMDVTHVINYQIPLDFKSYLHRIGRTGRAGKKGKAFTFVDHSNHN